MATIYQIAAKAGVSPKTAARILSGETKRSKGREAVLAWAQRLGYVRNASAANLRTGRSHLVGILVPYIDNPYYTSVIQEFHDALAEKNYQALIACSFGKPDGTISALNTFGSYNVDGILFNGSEGKLGRDVIAMLAQFQTSGKPVIVIGRASSRIAVDQADVENAAGISKAVVYLAAKGHRRIAFMGGRKTNRTMVARCGGFRKALSTAGLTVDHHLISLGEPTPTDAARRCLEMLTPKRSRPTAVVCGNDIMAMGVIKACRKSGLSVPRDVAVTGFDDIELAALFDPELTTLRQPISAIAHDCVRQLLHRIEEKKFGEPRRFLYEPELVVRGSA